jgi:hypothetical protein
MSRLSLAHIAPVFLLPSIRSLVLGGIRELSSDELRKLRQILPQGSSMVDTLKLCYARVSEDVLTLLMGACKSMKRFFYQSSEISPWGSDHSECYQTVLGALTAHQSSLVELNYLPVVESVYDWRDRLPLSIALFKMTALKRLTINYTLLMGKPRGRYLLAGKTQLRDDLWSGCRHSLTEVLPSNLQTLGLIYAKMALTADEDYNIQMRSMLESIPNNHPLLREITAVYSHDYSSGPFSLLSERIADDMREHNVGFDYDIEVYDFESWGMYFSRIQG